MNYDKKSKAMAAVAMSLALILTSAPLAFSAEDANEASIWYIGNGSDSDAAAVKSKLSASPYSWKINRYKSAKTANQEPTANSTGSISTYLYVDENDAGTYSSIGAKWNPSFPVTTSKWNGDLEWAIIAACNQLKWNDGTVDPSAYEWARVMLGSGSRMHSIMGYSGIAPSSYDIDTDVVNRFFTYASNTTNNKLSILDAWIKANNDHMTAWAAIYHYANKSDHLLGQGTVTGDTTGDPDIRHLSYTSSEAILFSLSPLAQSPFGDSKILKNNHTQIEVKARIPVVPIELPEILIDDTVIDSAKEANKFLGESKFKLTKEVKTERNVSYGTDDSLLEVYPSGGISYSNGKLEFTDIKFGKNTAVKKAKDFLINKGINTDEISVKDIKQLEEVKMDFSGNGSHTKRTLAYLVEFQRSFNGLPLDNGDTIRVEVDNGGIKNYWNGQRKIKGNGKVQELISIDQAFAELEANIDKAFQMPEKVEINDIQSILRFKYG